MWETPTRQNRSLGQTLPLEKTSATTSIWMEELTLGIPTLWKLTRGVSFLSTRPVGLPIDFDKVGLECLSVLSSLLSGSTSRWTDQRDDLAFVAAVNAKVGA